MEVSRLLAIFYDKRVAALSRLELRKILARKNPYLYRAISAGDAAKVVEELLRARISSSDETIFGNEFFEPLAIWVAEHANSDDPAISARTSSGAGVDVEVEFSSKFMAIAVKSGTSVFNAQSRAKQKDQFKQAQSRLFKNGKQFDPVVGYSYGRLNSKEVAFRELAGQSFWEELSGDPDLYVKIVDAMEEASVTHAALFQSEYDKALKRFTQELLLDFADEEGNLDWAKLVKFNSASVAPPWKSETGH
ncbi:MAG: hypothetical protein KF742_04575 [Cryobacterium sp.]|nr:hypothetical protein [Cryobacterium sp.]